MRTERYVSSSFANSPVCVANARVIYPAKPPDLWGLSNRDFRYGPIAAPVTASTEPPVPSARSSTRPKTSTTVILPNAGACAGPLLPRVCALPSCCATTPAPRRPLLSSRTPVPDSGSGRVPRQPLDAREDLAKERPCQVTFGELQGEVPGMPDQPPETKSNSWVKSG